MGSRKLVFSIIVAAAVAAPALAQNIELKPVVSGFVDPVLALGARDGTNRLFIVEQPGRVKILLADGTTPTFLDISAKVKFGGEQGMMGLAFHPDYSTNRRFFVNYTRADGAAVISEFKANAVNPNAADPAETILIVAPHPVHANHNAGMIAFGPDGFLYIATGDGGSGFDPDNRAQTVNDTDLALLGKILRIDVDTPGGGLHYSSPADNPYVGVPGRDEIYAIGLRNPYRFSFERNTGTLYVADVGQGTREEIDTVVLGGNYGWRVFEGTFCTTVDPAACVPANFIPPIYEYDHSGGGCAVIGGYAYQGPWQTFPTRAYLFGDWCTGEIWQLHQGTVTRLFDTTVRITGFGEDDEGELYVVGTVNGSGTLFSLRAIATLDAPAGPTLTDVIQTFSWTQGTRAERYWLYVGTALGASDIYNAPQGTMRSAMVSGLPDDGRPVYVRLYSFVDDEWIFRDHTFTAVSARAASIVTPAASPPLETTSVTVTWGGGIAVSAYWLYVGTHPGAADVYDAPQGTGTSRLVTNLPITGAPLYFRIYSKIGDVWQFSDAVVPTRAVPASITSPAPGTTLPGSSATFIWGGGAGVSAYWLYVGTARGASDIYGAPQGTMLSNTVGGLPTGGQQVFVRLYSKIGDAWPFVDYTYTAATPTLGNITTPAPGSRLNTTAPTFQWDAGRLVSDYWLTIGRMRGGYELYSQSAGTSLQTMVTGLPLDGGELWVRLFSRINGSYQFQDYQYFAQSPVLAQITSPTPGSQLSGTTATFTWSQGTGVDRYWLYVGTAQGGSDIYDAPQGASLSRMVTGLPSGGGTIWVRLYSNTQAGWMFVDYSYRATP